MIETIHLPILLKAIDFVFEEGRKILEERRERRKRNEAGPNSKDPEPAPETTPPDVQEQNEIKQELLGSKVDEILWQDHQMEVEHLVRLLETYSQNYRLAREQYAKWGSALVPPIVVNNLKEAETSMLETLEQLENALSKVYKREFHSTQ